MLNSLEAIEEENGMEENQEEIMIESPEIEEIVQSMYALSGSTTNNTIKLKSKGGLSPSWLTVAVHTAFLTLRLPKN